jgi:S-adenosylmethionine:tRNA ribosyltransferase-isomerase
MTHKEQAQQCEMKNFTYDLPEHRIAQYPLAERDLSKLLVYQNGNILEDTYRNLDTYVSEKSIFFFNNTKVIQARLHFKNSTGAKIEIFCLEPSEENAEPASAMLQKSSVQWDCLVGRFEKWKEKTISIKIHNFTLNAEVIRRNGPVFTIKFSWHPENLTFAEILDQLGEIPIPPYLKRESEEVDTNRYQTVYAAQKGSVAAPTAGLHFTEQIFEKLRSKDARIEYVTLHVGAGTFKPVKSETLEGHDMHSEWIEVDQQSLVKMIEQISDKQTNKNIVAVGTTSLRTIETLYWMGVKANQNVNATIHELEIKQWDAYEIEQDLPAVDSLHALLAWLNKNNLDKLICKTQILIVPSYKLRIANALITNFHQPNSTLLLLIAAVVGDEWKSIYNYALENDFRFLSYGDGSLLYSNKD